MKKLGTYTYKGWNVIIAKKLSLAKHTETGEVVIASSGEDIEDRINLYMEKNSELFNNV